MVDGGDEVVLDGGRGLRVGLGAVQQVEPCGGAVQVVARADGLQTAAQTVEGGEDGRGGGDDAQGVGTAGPRGRAPDGSEVVGRAQGREGGAQSGEGCELVAGRGQRREDRVDGVGQLATLGELGAEPGPPGLVGELAVEDQRRGSSKVDVRASSTAERPR